MSVVTAWEIVIKLGTGKLTLDRPLAEIWAESMPANDFTILNVTSEHVLLLERLPHHHRDPFDRLLIAQAIAEGLDLVSADSAFEAYPVHCIW